MLLELKLADEDRQRYGGPEWLPLDVDSIGKMRASEAERVEAEMDGVTIGDLIGGTSPARVVRGRLWFALRESGIKTEFATFDPLIYQIEARQIDGGDDADPPAGSTPEGSAGS